MTGVERGPKPTSSRRRPPKGAAGGVTRSNLLGPNTIPSIITVEPPIDHGATVRQMIQADPCGVLGHRFGMLVRGGVECTRCGARS